MWKYSVYEVKEFIKLNCFVNGHHTKYWKELLKQMKKLN